MSGVTLSIPFIVLSTKLSPRGEVEKHVLTPFGDVDITVWAAVMPGAGGLTLDVRVGEGIGCWMVADPTILQFRETLVQFVGGMVQEMLADSLADIRQLRIQFPGDERKSIAPWGLASKQSESGEDAASTR
jgi:hypothetical protein